MGINDLPFQEIWLADTEFASEPGERPVPRCYCAKELRTGREIRLFQHELTPECPFRTDAGVLYVSFVASAELNVHRVLGWAIPARVLDLSAEFRTLTNGLPLPAGKGLLGALVYYGLPHIDLGEKTEMRALAMRGGHYTAEEILALLAYCMTDVIALERLLPIMLPFIDFDRALVRGWYTGEAVSFMEHTGVPIDVETWRLYQDHWDDIQDALIAEVDAPYGVFDGRSFNSDRFADFLARNEIPWSTTATGKLELRDQVFDDMSQAYSILKPLRQLRQSLSGMRLHGLTVGHDGRNRTQLWPFSSTTGRNQPSNAEFIFGPGAWMRGLIRASEGYAIAYIDLSAAEFGIAAKLSEDPVMLADYAFDPYLGLGMKAGVVPVGATKKTHRDERDALKPCQLGLIYGMGPNTLATRLSAFNTPWPMSLASRLWEAHHQGYKKFWQWSDACADHAHLRDFLQTPLGWRLNSPFICADPAKGLSIRNFPVQGTCGDILRVACCLGIKRGIEIVAPVHDAVMINSPIDRIDADVATMQACLAEASRIVLSGFDLRTDSKIFKYPDRFMDPRGTEMWSRVERLMRGEGGARSVR